MLCQTIEGSHACSDTAVAGAERSSAQTVHVNDAGAGKKYPRAIQAALKRPLLLPGCAICRTRDAGAAAASHGVSDWPSRFTHSMEFAISAAAATPGKPSITGQLLWGAQQPKL